MQSLQKIQPTSVQKPGALPETIDALTIAYYAQVLNTARLKQREPVVEALMGCYEMMMKALKARLQADRTQLLATAAGVAGALAAFSDDRTCAVRAVAIARNIVEVVDEVGQ